MLNKWVNGCMDDRRRVNGQAGGWMDDWVGGGRDGRMKELHRPFPVKELASGS